MLSLGPSQTTLGCFEYSAKNGAWFWSLARSAIHAFAASLSMPIADKRKEQKRACSVAVALGLSQAQAGKHCLCEPVLWLHLGCEKGIHNGFSVRGEKSRE